MSNFGIILKRIREEKELKIRDAAKLIGRSAGWISEIENSNGKAKIEESEYRRILKIYEGEKFKKYFGLWVKNGQLKDCSQNESLAATFKQIRIDSKLTLTEVSQRTGLSMWQISRIENGLCTPRGKTKHLLCLAYGYKEESLRNFQREDKAFNSIPYSIRLKIQLGRLTEPQKAEVLHFIQNSFCTKTQIDKAGEQ